LRVHFEFVLGHLSRNSRYVRGLPCEHVSVVLQELDERAFLFVIEAGTNDRGLRSLENSRLILLVSSVGRIEVAIGASFEGIVKPFFASLSSFCAGRATDGSAVRAI
jgi:hypothetical protein